MSNPIKIMPQWQNFAKSGHADVHGLLTSINLHLNSSHVSRRKVDKNKNSFSGDRKQHFNSILTLVAQSCCSALTFLQSTWPWNETWKMPRLFLKKMAYPGLFSFIFVFSNTHYKFYIKYVCEKMSIQYTVPGFELMTFGTWLSCH